MIEGDRTSAGGGLPFSRTTLIVVIGVAAVSLAVAIVLTLAGDDLGARPSAGADGYSRSAIGHQGLVRLLEKLDIPVLVSRSNSGDKARNGLLIIAEPAVNDEASRARLTKLIESAPRILVVLPKWFGAAARGGAWIKRAELMPVEEIAPVINALDLMHPASVVRGEAVQWVVRPEQARPEISQAAQRLVTSDLVAVRVDLEGNELVGQATHDDRVLTVLADPDVLGNAGLRSPANARFIVELIDQLREDGPVVIDETMHGYAHQPSLFNTLTQFPLVLASAQMLICAVLVVWAAMVRFGPRRAAPPPIAPGKDFLIRNTAALLHYGGHHGHALSRYLQLTVAAVRQVLHAPALAPGATTAWLERVRKVRGGQISLADLELDVAAAATPARVVELADQIFRWRMEMTHGIDSRP